MKVAKRSILFFSEKEYPFAEAPFAAAEIITAKEPSELMEAVKREQFPLLIFDTAHRHFAESLVLRVYRRTPASDFWLLGEEKQYDFPEYLIDAVLPHNIQKGAFEDQVGNCLRLRSLLDDYNMIGKSPGLKRAAEIVAQVAPTDISTLIIGPSGSGKELIAKAIHQHSARREKPFIAINCGALAEGLLESELFGHERGAFTGAVGRREGMFRRAHGGTVFLDEIGETALAMQVKLLRVLEEGSFYRVGGEELVRADVRVVAATNRDLAEAIAMGEFRDDLYYRLGAMRINLPGLADRKADIMPLLNHFFTQQSGAPRGFSERAVEILVNYDWPGNVRQLKNFVSQAVVAHESGEISERFVTRFIEEQGYVERHLPVVTGKTPQQAEFQLIYQALLSLGQEVRLLHNLIMDNLPAGAASKEMTEPSTGKPAETIENMEEELIRKTLAETGGNRRQTAQQLGIGERTLYRKLKKYGRD